MTLRLYIDDSADSRTLRRLLPAAGHDIVSPADAGLLGARDADIFAHAMLHGLTILTKNPRDFLDLHRQTPGHAGILLVYQDNDPKRDMSDSEIVQAISNLLASGLPIAGEVHAPNHWRY